ncbi:LAFE_0D09670g1_1 [Lachancea fermentati]|uniref:LAFE_0D09670g1_1 n=1 Tax=Lachancea fermentati TaxID=4955 RepID=A0A1G4MBV8_LACFM|nr:LAFE_0D09670g1_1 [Lachancea fermentati]
MDKTPRVSYTLRAHESGITCLKLIELHSIPVLLSGDSQGNLFAWNFVTRRPFAYHAVKSQASIISLDYKGGYFTVQSRDNLLRFFKLDLDPSIPSGLRSSEKLSSLTPVYEIPINTLNFANVVIQHIVNDKFRLWCCNTMHSENLDVYCFDLGDNKSLKREFNSLDPFPIVKDLTKDSSKFKFEKLGIIMRLTEHEGIVYVGYESGFVLGLKMLPTIDDQKENSAENSKSLQFIDSGVNVGCTSLMELIYISAIHYPNPVLSLYYSQQRNVVLSTSTEDQIGLHTIKTLPELTSEDKAKKFYMSIGMKLVESEDIEKSNESIVLPTSKISHIATTDNSIVVSNWKGQTLVINDSVVSQRYFKARSNVHVEESCQGSFAEKKEVESPMIKVSAMTCLCGGLSNLDVYKSVGEQRRAAKVFGQNWCLIGYEDGSIVMQNI